MCQLEDGHGTPQIWPSGDKKRAELRHASNMSSRVQSSFSFPATSTIRCDVTCFARHVGTLTPIAHIPLVLAYIHRETAFTMCTLRCSDMSGPVPYTRHTYPVRFQSRAKERKYQGTNEGHVFRLHYSFH